MWENMIEALEECAERGWLVNNLFQLETHLWRANLRTEAKVTAFGQARTPGEALAIAMEGIEAAESYQVPETTFVAATVKADREALAAFAAKLRPQVHLVRRRVG